MSDKYAFIDGEEANYPIYKMCLWMKVSRSGFYGWRKAVETVTAKRRADLTAIVRFLFEEHKMRYGYRRIHAEMLRGGVTAGPELVRSIMVEEGLKTLHPKPFRVTTVQGEDENEEEIKDLLKRDFTSDTPGAKMVGDITYIHTWAGFGYLATVIDCASRMVIGWAFADHMRKQLIMDAISMASRSITFPVGAIFHSDRGSQYTSGDFAKHLKALGVRASMGRTGVCWDNSLAESFFASLKKELIYPTAFPSRDHARKAVAEYIEIYYNRRRLHSSLGHRTPHEAYMDLLNRPNAS